MDLARVSLIGLGITPPQPFNALGINFDLGLAQRLVGEQASLMPILRWMRQTESSMPSASSGNPRLHRQPPAETDMQEYFCVSPPSGSPDGANAGAGRVNQKATKNPSQHRSAR